MPDPALTMPLQPWQVEQVYAVSPSAAATAAAEALVVGGRWASSGCDSRAVWGRCSGRNAEPYDCAADHVALRFRCTCASRQVPCKHVVALLLLWARGRVPTVPPEVPGGPRSMRPHWLARWLDEVPVDASPVLPAAAGASLPANHDADSTGASISGSDAAGEADDIHPAPPAPVTDGDRTPDDRRARDERVRTTAAGLAEFDRWVHDRVRTGLADPSLGMAATWDDAAARLVDAKAGALANRVRRMGTSPLSRAGRRSGIDARVADAVTGAAPLEHMLAELSLLHVLADAAQRLDTLPSSLADSVAIAVGWQVRQADVLAGVPETDHWVVMGRSDTREDRIDVRRSWLRAVSSRRWAMVLSFAAYGQALDDSLVAGRRFRADIVRYPGVLGLRALVARVHDEGGDRGTVDGGDDGRATDAWSLVGAADIPGAVDIAAGCAEVGAMVAAEPWIERVPVCVRAAPCRIAGGWGLADHTGVLPLAVDGDALGVLLACAASGPVPITCEWTPSGVVPIAMFLDDRPVDIGPVADASFSTGGLARAVSL
ncbi:MAG: SWIM zinc finger family protein [Ilumatobacteraceae bacterium]